MKDKDLNIEHPTSNSQHPSRNTNFDNRADRRNYDLEERLLIFAARVVRLSNRLPCTRAGNHIAKQLIKSGTSPLPNHGEAQAAESTVDFRHKLKICLKELREAYRWLRLIARVHLVKAAPDTEEVRSLTVESQELIRIFFVSIRTSQAKDQR
jgi:four helix bundle protein